MRILRLIVAFLLGVVCAVIGASVAASAPGKLNSGDMVAICLTLVLAISFFISSTSFAKQRKYVFVVAAIIFVVGGLFLVFGANTNISPELAQQTSITVNDVAPIVAEQSTLRAQGIYSFALGILFAMIALVLHMLIKRKMRSGSA